MAGDGTGVRTEGGWCLSLKELLYRHRATGRGPGHECSRPKTKWVLKSEQ